MSRYSCQEHGDTAELGCVACELATDFKELQAKVEQREEESAAISKNIQRRLREEDAKRMVLEDKIEDLEYDRAALKRLISEMFTKKEIRAVLTDAYSYAVNPSGEVDKLIQAMVKNKAALK